MKYIYLVTGASSDMGLGLIKRVITGDCMIIAQYATHAEELNALREQYPDKVFPIPADLTSEESCAGFIKNVMESFPCPTHFVHLPALKVVNRKFKDFDMERFHADFSLQVNSALIICKAVLPAMAKQKFGRVLFMQSSYTIGCPPKNTEAYVIAKQALSGLCKTLAADYASKGITVNMVAPSMVETKFLSDTSSLIVEAAAAGNPMGRNAQVEDVVPAMQFLLSEEARFITGVTLPITGGEAIL